MIISMDDILSACDFVNSYFDDLDGYCEIVLDLRDGSVLAYHHSSLFDVKDYDRDRFVVQRGFMPHGRRANPRDVYSRFRFAVNSRRCY